MTFGGRAGTLYEVARYFWLSKTVCRTQISLIDSGKYYFLLSSVTEKVTQFSAASLDERQSF